MRSDKDPRPIKFRSFRGNSMASIETQVTAWSQAKEYMYDYIDLMLTTAIDPNDDSNIYSALLLYKDNFID